jgi:hypothetical protein
VEGKSAIIIIQSATCLNSKDFSGPDMYNDYHLIVFLKEALRAISPATGQSENPGTDGKMRLRKMLAASLLRCRNWKLTSQNTNV